MHNNANNSNNISRNHFNNNYFFIFKTLFILYKKFCIKQIKLSFHKKNIQNLKKN